MWNISTKDEKFSEVRLGKEYFKERENKKITNRLDFNRSVGVPACFGVLKSSWIVLRVHRSLENVTLLSIPDLIHVYAAFD